MAFKYRKSDHKAFEWNTLYTVEYEIKIGIETLRRILENQAQLVKDLAKGIDSKITNDETLSTVAQEYQSSYFFHIYNSDIDLMNEIIRFQRYAMVLSIFSFFECRMLELCKLVMERFKLEEKFDSLKNDDYLHKYWKFLTKECKIEKADIEKFYTPIKNQKFTRNKIAHEKGVFPTNKLKNFIKADGLSLFPRKNGTYLIIIERDIYNKNLLNNTEKFLMRLLLAIDSMKDPELYK